MTEFPSARERGPAPLNVRAARPADLEAIAEIGSEAFSGLRPLSHARSWVTACWNAAPRMRYWVAESEGRLVGYILWVEKGGFRDWAVIELEQIAVRAGARRSGVGATLIRKSLDGIREAIHERGSRLKLVEVTTGSEQGALGFYDRVLGAKVVGKIPDFFRGDEYILIARELERDPT